VARAVELAARASSAQSAYNAARMLCCAALHEWQQRACAHGQALAARARRKMERGKRGDRADGSDRRVQEASAEAWRPCSSGLGEFLDKSAGRGSSARAEGAPRPRPLRHLGIVAVRSARLALTAWIRATALARGWPLEGGAVGLLAMCGRPARAPLPPSGHGAQAGFQPEARHQEAEANPAEPCATEVGGASLAAVAAKPQTQADFCVLEAGQRTGTPSGSLREHREANSLELRAESSILLVAVIGAWCRVVAAARCRHWQGEADADRMEAVLAWAQTADLEVRVTAERAARLQAEAAVASSRQHLRGMRARDLEASVSSRAFVAWCLAAAQFRVESERRALGAARAEVAQAYQAAEACLAEAGQAKDQAANTEAAVETRLQDVAHAESRLRQARMEVHAQVEALRVAMTSGRVTAALQRALLVWRLLVAATAWNCPFETPMRRSARGCACSLIRAVALCARQRRLRVLHQTLFTWAGVLARIHCHQGALELAMAVSDVMLRGPMPRHSRTSAAFTAWKATAGGACAVRRIRAQAAEAVRAAKSCMEAVETAALLSGFFHAWSAQTQSAQVAGCCRAMQAGHKEAAACRVVKLQLDSDPRDVQCR